MDLVAAGFWGAFFGTATLMVAIPLSIWLRARRQVALLAALMALSSALFAACFLGGLPLEGDAEARALAHIGVATSIGLALMLMITLGTLREPQRRSRVLAAVLGGGVAVLAAGWLLPARDALLLGAAASIGLAVVMLGVTVRRARRGERGGWSFVVGMALVLVSLSGLSWIALFHPHAWPVHAISAVAATSYLVVVGRVLWARYSYLIELAEVMAHGPSYDPVTRMRSHSETGQMVGDFFFRREDGVRPVGVIAICIANLYALENLHGRAAYNHALFVCAGRLRRTVPEYVEMGRIGEDGFLLLVRNARDLAHLAGLARTLRDRLSRPVALSTRRDPAGLESSGTTWAAEVGIGLLATTTEVRPAHVVASTRAMARTAWSYASRLAFYDEATGQIAEVPGEGSAWAGATAGASA